MKYAYEDLSDKQFEDLAIAICYHLFGASVQGFCEGKDSGRDGKFVGTAELYPSKAAPWVGTVIIQAKHTNGYNRLFSDSDFFSPEAESTVLGEEIPRVIKMRVAKEIDHYIVFANRRLSAGTETKIRKYLSERTGIPESSLCLAGVEQIEMWLKRFPDAVKAANLDPIERPLIVSPDELADVVEALAAQTSLIKAAIEHPPTERVTYKEKNELNQMSAQYAKDQRKKYLKDTLQIQEFLASPDNADVLKKYETSTDEFQAKIISKRKDYESFDDIMEYLVDLLFARDALLRSNKRLTRTVLFYMYWHCDIGEVPDASTE